MPFTPSSTRHPAHPDHIGRHRDARSAWLAPAAALVSAMPTVARTLRKPVATGAVAVGVLAATAAGYAHPSVSATSPRVTEAAFVTTLNPVTAITPGATMGTATIVVDNGPTASQTNEADYADKLDAANARRADRAAATARKAAAAKAAALVKQRKAAAERAARVAARKAILARAQSNPKAVAQLLLAEHGWGGSQFSCLSSLWTKESGWKYNADNPSSSAYGIPQALPGSKMASFGSDWRTNPVTQIKWGLDYIADRYGSPCSAWAHSRASNWY